jgi:hypothetical protein
VTCRELQVAPLGGLVSCRAFGKRNQRFGQVPIKRFTTKLLAWRKPLEPDSGKIRPAWPRNSTLSVRLAEQPSRAFWHNNRVIVVIRVSEGSNQGSAHHYTRQHTQQRLLSAFMEIRFQETNGPTWSAIYHYARAWDPAESILYQIIFIHAVFSSGRFLLKLWPLRRHFYCSVIITHRIMGHYSNSLMVALGGRNYGDNVRAFLNSEKTALHLWGRPEIRWGNVYLSFFLFPWSHVYVKIKGK